MDDFTAADDYVVQATQQHPDRLVGAMVVNSLTGDAALTEIERRQELGFKAIKSHSTLHSHDAINGGSVDSVAQLAGELSLPIGFTATSATVPVRLTRSATSQPGFLTYYPQHPEEDRLVRKMPA